MWASFVKKAAGSLESLGLVERFLHSICILWCLGDKYCYPLLGRRFFVMSDQDGVPRSLKSLNEAI